MSTATLPLTHAVISLLGEVALLLWGVHMVQSGVLRAYGGALRRLLARSLGNRLAALLVGAGVTVALQSSTATALMLTSFLAGGVLGLGPALAVMLGANAGSALVVWALAFDITLVFPLLLAAGLVTFRAGTSTQARNAGRVAIGLGLMLLALHLLVETVAPPGGLSPEARELVALATREPLPVLLLTMLLTWAMHSSIAAVLVIATFADAGLLAPAAVLAMVLGANLGSAFNPLLAARAGARDALRLAVGNLANRLLGAVAVLLVLPALAGWLARLQPDPGRMAVAAHLGLNLALAAACLPVLPGLAWALAKLLPERPAARDDPAAPRHLDHLDEAALATPAVALAGAAREVLHMADVVEEMIRGARELVRRDDQRRVAELRRKDDVLDRLHASLQRFLGELGRRASLSEAERGRLGRVLAAAMHLEHAGDVIDKGLIALADKRIRRRQRLTARERDEAWAMHDHLLAQLRLAAAVVMAEDLGAALRLVEGKERFRDLERAATLGEFALLQRGGDRRPETGRLHLDLVREVKNVQAHLAAIAHPLLERHRLLRPSRLVRAPASAPDERHPAPG